MIDKNRERLNQLLEKRSKKLENVLHFQEHFQNFKYYLSEIIETINTEISNKTNEHLMLFADNPYKNSDSRFFAMVQLFLLGHRRNAFLLDNSENNPLIEFKGDEFTGNVRYTIIFGDNIILNEECPITQLLDKDIIFEIILNFLDIIYNSQTIK